MVAAGLVVQLSVVGFASAQLAPPPPTPVPPDGSLSPFPQALDTPADSTAPPDLSAPSAILVDLDTGQVLFAKNPDAERPVASLTKVMTALLVLERSRRSDVATVQPDAVIPTDARAGVAALGLRPGERIAVGQLLYALLLQSANDAAVALADQVSGSQARFVQLMDVRAARLGMRRTHFLSANGLDDHGYSTARDLARLARAAMATPGFPAIVHTEFHSIPSTAGPDRKVQNRNVLLWLYPGATGIKTGYTARAGYCEIATAERDGRREVAVVLGAPSDAFSDAATLLNYGFAAFAEHTFVSAGAPGGVVELAGGSVQVEMGAGLRALVPTAALDAVRDRVVVDPTAAYPPAPGERVATLRITLPNLTVGSVPLLVSSVPPPPALAPAAWWERTAAALARAASAALHAIIA
jgi:D-alanyl-D-alanine carboxypeptidase (penicillin-binding protein 5/6)